MKCDHRRRRALLRAALVLVSLGSTSIDAAEGELLDAARAFPMTARYDGRTILVRFDVADGYYLYRDKLRFSTEPGTVKLAKPVLPRGEIRKDEFFGRVEVYRGSVEIKISLTSGSPPAQLILKSVSQGCADAGVCYTPREERLTVVNGGGPVSTPGPRAPGGRSLLEELGGKP
jgi:thiol:disulfide interchange protein DsbD